MIPEDELWLHTPVAKAKLDRAIEWAEKHPTQVSNLDALEREYLNRIALDLNKAVYRDDWFAPEREEVLASTPVWDLRGNGSTAFASRSERARPSRGSAM